MQFSDDKNQPTDSPPLYNEEPDDQHSEILPLYEDQAPPEQQLHNASQTDTERTARKPRSRFASALKGFLIFWIVAYISLQAYHFIDRTWHLTHHGPKPHHPHHHKHPGCNLPHPTAERRYTRHETSNAIKGEFDLFDLLDLSTQSGSIDVTVTPHPGSEPAVLKLHSNAGSVTVRIANHFLGTAQSLLVPHRGPAAFDEYPALAPLNRTFVTEIHTNSGAIKATVLGGNGGKTVVESNAGSLDLDLLMIGAGEDSRVSQLRTLTQSGRQMIRVDMLERLSTDKLTKLAASHHVQGSASLDVRYPREWEGRLESTIQGSGQTDVAGAGLVIDEEYGSVLRAHKGEGTEVVRILEQGSGSVKFRC